MGRWDLLRVAQVRDAYRLIGECRDVGHDPAAWASRLLEGLCRLVGASAGSGGEGLAPTPAHSIVPLSMFQWGMDESVARQLGGYVRAGGPAVDPMFADYELAPDDAVTRTRSQRMRDADYERSMVFDRFMGPARIGHRCASLYRREGKASFSVVHLLRELGERDYSAREQQVMDFVQHEVGPLVGRALVSIAEPGPANLSPRLLDTLYCLLEGDSEKQVAARLKLSRPTVHQYVTALYRRFGVSSRAGLMAHALRRGWRPLRVAGVSSNSVRR